MSRSSVERPPPPEGRDLSAFRCSRWAARALAAVLANLSVAALADTPRFDASHWHALLVAVDGPAATGEGIAPSATAADLAAVLRGRGVADVTALTGAKVDRAAMAREMTGLVDRTQAGDTVVIAFEGWGRPAATPGLAVDLLMPGATRARPRDGDAVRGTDLEAVVRRVEERGGRAILVADAWSGDESRRRPTAAGLSGPLPVLAGAPFQRSIVLYAADPGFESRPIAVPGAAGRRRALGFAVARGLEGRADFDRDGQVSGPELVAYAARLVYQLSDQRQKIAALLPATFAAAGAEGPALTRGIVVKAVNSLADLPLPPPDAPARPAAAVGAKAFDTPVDAAADVPVRIAAGTGSEGQMKLAPREAKVEAVARTDNPDLIWDPASRDIITADGDFLTQAHDTAALGGAIDRVAALRRLKQLVISAPQQIDVQPSDAIQKRGGQVKVEVNNAAGRSLVLFNIRGDGAVQLLYPQANDPPIITDPKFTLPLAVSLPLGADQIVAVTGTQRLVDLEKGLADLNGRRKPVQAIRMVHDLALPGTLVGFAEVFSGIP